MIRRLILLAAVAAVLVLAAFWFLTAPATVPASALPAHTPDLANGKEMFYAGGCASCHAIPKQADKTRLGGGLALNSPFGTFYVPNISPDPNDGIGAWSEAQFVTAMTKGTSPDGRASLSGLSLYVLSAHAARRPARSVRLSQDAAGGGGTSARPRPAVPVQHPPRARRSGSCCFSTASRSSPIRRNRRNGTAAPIWSTGPATARNVIRRATCSAASIESQRFAGGPSPDGEGGVPNITQYKLKNWSEADIAELLEDRHDARRRPGWRQHGRGGAQHLAS